MKEYAKQFYTSRKWKNCRRAYINERIKVDGGECEICHDAPGYIVHHKIHITPDNIEDPEITLNHNNLQYVCKECHDGIDGHGLNNKTSDAFVEFTEDGQPIMKREEEERRKRVYGT